MIVTVWFFKMAKLYVLGSIFVGFWTNWEQDNMYTIMYMKMLSVKEIYDKKTMAVVADPDPVHQ